MGAKASVLANRLASRNASDTLILLIELATESGDDYIEANALFADLLRVYVEHMERRDLYWFLQLPCFSKKNVARELKCVANDLENDAQTNTREAIYVAKESIAVFLSESKPFTDETIITFEPKVISEEIKNLIRGSFNEVHEKVERYPNGPQTVDDAKALCMANRTAIVYLYLVRFGHEEIVEEEKLETFRTDINHTVYYNRLLQRSKTVKISHDVQQLLTEYSNSEIRRPLLLHAIIDNDIRQAQVLLQKALIEAIPDIQFLAEMR
jgi:hypothetical protein